MKFIDPKITYEYIRIIHIWVYGYLNFCALFFLHLFFANGYEEGEEEEGEALREMYAQYKLADRCLYRQAEGKTSSEH